MHLGDDGGRGDAQGRAFAPHQPLLLPIAQRPGNVVNEQRIGRLRQRGQRRLHGPIGGVEDADLVDDPGRDHAHRGGGHRADAVVEAIAGRGRQALGIIHARQGLQQTLGLGRQNDRARDHRPGPGSPTGLIQPGHHASLRPPDALIGQHIHLRHSPAAAAQRGWCATWA